MRDKTVKAEHLVLRSDLESQNGGHSTWQSAGICVANLISGEKRIGIFHCIEFENEKSILKQWKR
jgi:hypothetical protein